MPEYLAPGVFVEETSFRNKSIEGVGTSVAALVGPTRSGPLRGLPEVLTSYAEFERIYGDAQDLAIGTAGAAVPNYTAHAARAFFDNGGKQLFVVRVAADGTQPRAASTRQNADDTEDVDATETPEPPEPPENPEPPEPPEDAEDTDDAESAAGIVSFFSRFPGKAGEYTLELRWRDAALRHFDLDVRSGGKDGEVIYTYGELSIAADGPGSLAAALPAEPERRAEALSSPIAASIEPTDASEEQIRSALIALCDSAAITPPANSLDGPRYLITLAGGSDGGEPTAIDYAGKTDEVRGSTGLKALEDIEDVSIVMTPAAAASPEDVHKAVVLEVQKHCRRMRYRIGVVDSRKDQSIGEVRAFAGNFDDSRLALYYPWVVTPNPAPDPAGTRRDIAVPPSGFIAGIYSRTDVDRGVHKAPANEVVLGALRFDQQINAFQQELLNPNGINVLRSFAGRGHRVWGGRTLASDPEWKYVNVRRYFLYLERSIEKSTQWAVFEPNGEALWANIRSSVEDFLFSEWRNGRLLGGTPKEAYFVRCDRSTMTQNDIDNGRMVCLVGVAALKPAEFVIFRIGQKTADA